MMVMTMTAIDYDDVEEGNNAKLTYSIEKNVIDENTGTPIFEIEETTGVIKTAVCCLDREKTPDYSIQVVAMDGGGLKGTGTASIKVRLFRHAGECNGCCGHGQIRSAIKRPTSGYLLLLWLFWWPRIRLPSAYKYELAQPTARVSENISTNSGISFD